MNRLLLLFVAVVTMYACSGDSQQQNDSKKMNNKYNGEYPTVRKDTVVDDYHGTTVADPYRWLEDDASAETKAWVEAQNKVTYSYLDRIPFRKEIADRYEALWNYERYSSPFKRGDKFYYYKNDGLQNQSVIYVTDDINKEGEVFLDPNTFSKDGTASLSGISFSKDGKYCAYFVSEGGSDWKTGYVLSAGTGKLLDDKVEWAKFSGLAWFKDGFYYSRYPSPKGDEALSGRNEHHALYYHKLGTPQSEDKQIYVDMKHPLRNVYSYTTDDERFLVMSTTESTSGNDLYIKDLSNDGKLQKIVEGYDYDFSVIDNDDRYLYIMTNKDAPNKQVFKVDVSNPSNPVWKEFIPESKDALSGISSVGGKLFANYLHNASSLVKVFDVDGTFIQDLELPGIGSVGGVSGKKEDKMGFFSFNSYISSPAIYYLDVENLTYKPFRKSEVDFDSDQYETKQVWYTSKDGTRVPMTITMKKGTVLDGTNPTLLYGYGGFDISILPRFSTSRLPLLEHGGIYAVANIRGGGEFGAKWHENGTKGNKQNVFDDFIAAAEYLIENKYTNSNKLAIEGRSNGGLLIGACMTQRPDLYAVAFPNVGVLDMLRYHQFTIGWAWATDYGRSDEKEAFEYLYKYSPLHNVKKVAYPATLVNTADHDDRVVPAHSFKFISTVQEHHTGDTPVMIRVETNAGHGAGKSTKMQIQDAADNLAFLLFNMNEEFMK